MGFSFLAGNFSNNDFSLCLERKAKDKEVRKKRMARITVVFTKKELVFVPKIDSTPPKASIKPPLLPRWIRITPKRRITIKICKKISRLYIPYLAGILNYLNK